VSESKSAVEIAAIKQYCKRLHMPTVAAQRGRLAEQAIKERQGHLVYLEALLDAEVEERERNVVARRIKEAHFPKAKTLEEFDFQTASHLPAWRLRKLAEGEYIVRAEPVILLGETDPATFCTSLLHH
jgi:DNA replication protein DnaC